MSTLPLALTLSLLMTVSTPLPNVPTAALAAQAVEAQVVEEPAAPVPEVPMIYASSKAGEPAAYPIQMPVLMYHHVVYNWEKYNEMTVTVGRLEQDLQWLTENGYHTVLPRELAAGQPLPEKPILITFDDGYQSNYTLAYPLLQKYQAKAAIALMVYMQDYPGGSFLTWDMCREMAASGLVEFGSHGYVIHNLDNRMGNFVAGQANGVQRKKGESDVDFQLRVLEDLRCSYQRIAEELGTAPTFFSYPFGKTDPDADAYLRRLFRVTAITGPGKYAANLSEGLYKLPRFTVTMKATPKSLLKNL